MVDAVGRKEVVVATVAGVIAAVAREGVSAAGLSYTSMAVLAARFPITSLVRCSGRPPPAAAGSRDVITTSEINSKQLKNILLKRKFSPPSSFLCEFVKFSLKMFQLIRKGVFIFCTQTIFVIQGGPKKHLNVSTSLLFLQAQSDFEVCKMC